jgi:tetratricopeptide (TPR) repeat protein
MTIEEKYELFDASLENRLSKEENSVLYEMLKDIEIKKEFDTYVQIQNEYINWQKIELDKKVFKQNLDTVKLEQQDTMSPVESDRNNSNAIKVSFVKKYLIPLSAAAVILIGVFVAMQTGLFTAKQQIAAFAPDELSMERGMEADTFANIVTLYNEKKYQEALPLIETYQKAHPENINIQLAKAICYLDKKDFPLAENELQLIIAQNNMYKEKAQWYLANVYLKQGKQEALKSIFKSIRKDHFYYTAMKLIAQ